MIKRISILLFVLLAAVGLSSAAFALPVNPDITGSDNPGVHGTHGTVCNSHLYKSCNIQMNRFVASNRHIQLLVAYKPPKYTVKFNKIRDVDRINSIYHIEIWINVCKSTYEPP